MRVSSYKPSTLFFGQTCSVLWILLYSRDYCGRFLLENMILGMRFKTHFIVKFYKYLLDDLDIKFTNVFKS